MLGSDIKWRVNSTPRFTVLTFGEYMAADDGPRETMLRDMRFERLARSLVYRRLRHAVARFLVSPTRDRTILENCRNHLEQEKVAATSPQQRENCVYELRALEVFERSLNALEIHGLNFEHSPAVPPLKMEGVAVSVQPTARIRVRRTRGHDLVGAIVLDVAKGIEPKTEASKARCIRAMLHSAILVHQQVGMGSVGEDERPSADHAIVFHAHRQERVCAPGNHRKMLRNMEAVCRTVARQWKSLEPPTGFDASAAVYR